MLTNFKGIPRALLMTLTVLLIPLIAMQFTSEVNWTLFDFIVMGGLLFFAGLMFELIISKAKDGTTKALLVAALVLVFLLIWIDLAVGIFNIPGISGS